MSTYLISLLLLVVFTISQAQSIWPKEIQLEKGEKVIIYQLQPEALEGNLLKARAAISIRHHGNDEPLFGVMWTEARLLTERDERMATLENIVITHIRFSDTTEESQLNALKSSLEQQIPQWHLDIALDDLLATLGTTSISPSAEFNNAPPQIFYRPQPTMLVMIDGEPLHTFDEELSIDRVINTPFLIVLNPEDRRYYLYSNQFWYQSTTITQGWQVIKKLPKRIKKLKKKIEKQQGNTPISQYVFYEDPFPPAILVSTVPAELIQSEGEPEFASIEGTGLLYISNSDNEIFLDIDSQQYYVVLSGRWYTAKSLEGPWSYRSSSTLPEDFAMIPEDSEKGNVLIYVAGTQAAKEAVIDAQIPQTARVDRHTAQCNVVYDGSPQFEPIKGTRLELAINASTTVLKDNERYFCVENGVWFVSEHATGPWELSVDRPSDIDRIPPSCSAYNVRYVYIYDVTPDFIYMGYTPAYLGCFVWGPTIVYGTGYYYQSWYRRYYYPRPLTWGFAMLYDPWTGWSISLGFDLGWYYWVSPYRYYGWWGPPRYRPPHYQSYRASRARLRVSPTQRRYYYPTNLYRYRRDTYTRDITRRSNRVYVPPSGGRSQQSTPIVRSNRQTYGSDNRKSQQARTSRNITNNVYTDRQGNIYRRNQSEAWQLRESRTWKPVSRENTQSMQQLQKQREMRDRGQVRSNTFNQATKRKTTTNKKKSNRGSSNP